MKLSQKVTLRNNFMGIAHLLIIVPETAIVAKISVILCEFAI